MQGSSLMLGSQRDAIALRDFSVADMLAVRSLLEVLPHLYPGGEGWLTRRLHDALAGRARCHVAVAYDRILGVAIDTAKSTEAIKLNTLYVDSAHRGRGVGGLLVDRVLGGRNADRPPETYITVAHHLVPDLERTLLPRGFTRTALERNRYGRGRHEAVFTHLSE